MSEEQNALVVLSNAKNYLSQARDLVAVLKVRDMATAAHAWAVARNSDEAAQYAMEIKLRSERKAGEFLKEMKEQGQLSEGGRPAKTTVNLTEVSKPSLKSLGVEENESQRWQRIAAVPEERFEQYLATTQKKTQSAVLKVAIQMGELEKPKINLSLPKGKYRTVVIDPPWFMEKIVREVRPNQTRNLDYPTMTFEEIKDKPIVDFMDEKCHVYLWTTHKNLPEAFELFCHWNVNYQCLLTWVKNVGFTPYSWMYSTEHVLFGRKGNLNLLKNGERLDFFAKVREHSRKPDEFYELVKKVSPEPRIDVFSREKRDGFDQYGNEVDKFNGI